MRHKIKTPEELEALLLSGSVFACLSGISSEGLKNTFGLLSGRPAAAGASYAPSLLTVSSGGVDTSEFDKLNQRLTKLTRALERLKNAFLFDDSVMSEKEYLETKNGLDFERVGIENKIKNLSESSFSTRAGEIAFVKSASSFLLTHEIQSGDFIKYSEFASTIEDETLKDFVNLVLDHIVIDEGRVSSITFKNGLEHTFLYRE